MPRVAKLGSKRDSNLAGNPIDMDLASAPHAHSETQIAFWSGGSPVEARIGDQVARYDNETALGSDAFEMHDATLLEPGPPAFFLTFMISKAWLDNRRLATGRPLILPSPRVPVSVHLREACWRTLDSIVDAEKPRATIDDEIQQLLVAAIAASTSRVQATNNRIRASCLDRRLRAAIAFMRENMTEKCTIGEVASIAGLSAGCRKGCGYRGLQKELAARKRENSNLRQVHARLGAMCRTWQWVARSCTPQRCASRQRRIIAPSA